jgi:hypothetical protein
MREADRSGLTPYTIVLTSQKDKITALLSPHCNIKRGPANDNRKRPMILPQ